MIVHLQKSDMPDVLSVQREAYRPELLESAETFERKLQLFPQGCFGCKEGDKLKAYVFTHPWISDVVAPLDCEQLTLPDSPDCLYIHDLAVRKSAQGSGIGGQLLDAVFALADERGYRNMALVAVQDSEPYWQRRGFTPCEKLLYGGCVPATHMVLRR
ncbi:MAG TPA: GNAT family N-acetyltransferase [Planctomycetota bacterium]|nr:GNAT family N-acetyltransferase [Planctomycetota bacterium]